MSVATTIQNAVACMPEGEPFTTQRLLQYGSRAAVDKTLSRLVQSGKLTRITRGVYLRPEYNRFVGQVAPEPFKIAASVAEKTCDIIQISGAEAARRLGLTTQMVTQPTFLTTGPSRTIKAGNLTITLKHVSRKKIPFIGSDTGVAILALWYLGKDNVTSEHIKTLEKKLSSKNYQLLVSAKEQMPIWMVTIIHQYEKEKNNV